MPILISAVSLVSYRLYQITTAFHASHPDRNCWLAPKANHMRAGQYPIVLINSSLFDGYLLVGKKDKECLVATIHQPTWTNHLLDNFLTESAHCVGYIPPSDSHCMRLVAYSSGWYPRYKPCECWCISPFLLIESQIFHCMREKLATAWEPWSTGPRDIHKRDITEYTKGNIAYCSPVTHLYHFFGGDLFKRSIRFSWNGVVILEFCCSSVVPSAWSGLITG